MHEDVDKISFTGSIATARKLLQNSAVSNLKRLSLELGGKSPNIVFPDADFERRHEGARSGASSATRARCAAPASRLLVHEDIHDRFVKELARAPRKLRLGNPLDPATQMGSQISARQMDTHSRLHRDAARQEGAQAGGGGERDTEGDKAKGFFVKPTVFADVKPEDADRARGDLRAGGERDPLSGRRRRRSTIANGTIYGLAAAVWTRDVQLAHRMAGGDQGRLGVDQHLQRFDSGSPFGGYKQSGFGRDLGSYALEQYTNVKSVWVAL